MKAIRFIVAAFLTLSVAASCQPSAEELAKQYKDLTVELAQAKLSGDEEKPLFSNIKFDFLYIKGDKYGF